jgi:uncharacterized protein
MDQTEKQQIIEATRQQIGWIYSDLPWFTEQEAKSANKKRNELFKRLSGWISYTDGKPHNGQISPGCEICGNGKCKANFISNQCTRNCFFCWYVRSDKKSFQPEGKMLQYKDAMDQIAILRTSRFEGVSFTGGEPLLALDELLSILTVIRKEFYSSIYVWLYTNGDLIDRSSLERLREAGLDEIRVNLAARNYDLSPVVLARKYLSTVTVEIPAIPEDIGLLKNLLGDLESIGVNYLNLIQLEATRHNYEALRMRGYHFLHNLSYTPMVFESDICAIELLLFAREHQIRLPIHYCCYPFRYEGVKCLNRRWWAERAVKGWEEITRAGYIRSFRILDTIDSIKNMIRCFETERYNPTQWQFNKRNGELAVHSDLLPYVDWGSANVSLLYFDPFPVANESNGYAERNFADMKRLIYKEPNWSQSAIECWRRLYLENENPTDVFKSFFINYPITSKNTMQNVQEEIKKLEKLARWEKVDGGLREVF